MTRDLFPFIVLDKTIERLTFKASSDPRYAQHKEKIISVLKILHVKFTEDMHGLDKGQSKAELQELFDKGLHTDHAVAIFTAVLMLAVSDILKETAAKS